MREIQTSLLPFHLHRKTVQVPLGFNVCQIVDYINPANVQGVNVVVNIGDNVVPKHMWKNVTPKPNALVGVNLVPSGGGGNAGKQVLGAVIAVAAIVTGQFYGASLASSLGFASATATTAATAGITIGLSLVGSLALAMLSSVPRQNRGSAATTISESPTQFIEGASNSINRYGVIPVNLGVNRMFPPQAALPFTETSGGEQFSRQLFTWGYGNVELSELKIGETSLSSFSEVETENKLTGNLNETSSLYPDDYYQENLSILMNEVDGYSTRTSQNDTDEIEVDFTFQQGLVRYSETGERLTTTVVIQVEYKLSEGSSWTILPLKTVTNSTSEAVRVSVRSTLSTKGQYDIRVKRVTDDATDTQIFDKFYWTAIKSITYGNPVLKEGISGTAMRILATNQLNGSVDRFNAVVSSKILQYNSDLETWTEAVSSNPAAIYRHVLQSPAFVKRLNNSRIDVTKLEEWSVYCETKGLTFNKVIDYETSIDDLLNDIAASGMATPQKVSGVYSVIIDNERPAIRGMVTPRNSWGYRGSINYPELPHCLRVEFRNPDKGYEVDERLVYRDGYNSSNSTLIERLQFTSCTDADAAYYYARVYFASATLQPETHEFKMDIENLCFNRGDRIVFVNDSILVGIGQGRIKSLTYDDEDTPASVLSFTLDDYITVPSASSFAVRIRHSDASGYVYYALNTSPGETNSFTFSTPVDVGDAPGIGSLCAFVEDGLELDLIVRDIRMDKDYNATITAIDYAPARFTDGSGIIPPFSSNVTLPADVFQPYPPELRGSILTDESVMLRNSDGSITSRMIISLVNRNVVGVEPIIRIRVSGSSTWTDPDILTASSDKISLTGLQDATNYDIHIRYQSLTGSRLISQPLQLNSVFFAGASGVPNDVTGFKVNVHNGMGYFEWDNNTDIDFSHYYLRFSGLTTGVTWETSQILARNVSTNRISLPIQIGTFLIKAVDLSGNESSNAVTIISNNDGLLVNVVETLSGQTDWSGIKDNTQVEQGTLTLIDTASTGYYYYPKIDMSEVYESVLSSSLLAIPTRFLRIRSVAAMRSVSSVRGYSGVSLRSIDSIRSLSSFRGISASQWFAGLQLRKSDDDITWTEWEDFVTGNHLFRYAEFRLVLSSTNVNVSPKVITANVSVDMPDRYETGEDINCPVEGVTVEYTYPFKNNPSVNITLQNAAVDDRIEYVSKSSENFTIKVYSESTAGYVSRTFDFISAGYGRVH